jgi:N-succinyldiaminopimelate aminotransferase
MTFEEWKLLFELSDKYGFVIISDECYSEIYFDETKPPWARSPPRRSSAARAIRAWSSWVRCRSDRAPQGCARATPRATARSWRSTCSTGPYHGSAISNAVQLASVAAWKDEAHVVENRRLYREKFAAFYERVNPVLPLTRPEAAFYYWVAVPGGDDLAFRARSLTPPKCHGAPGQLHRPRSPGRESRPRLRAHGAGVDGGRKHRGRHPHRGIRVQAFIALIDRLTAPYCARAPPSIIGR